MPSIGLATLVLAAAVLAGAVASVAGFGIHELAQFTPK